MAKRKRLGPAQDSYLASPAPAGSEGGGPGLSRPGGTLAPSSAPASPPPIAQVSGDASARAALQELSDSLAAARRDGLLIERVPLTAVDLGYLTRDRLEADAEELESLVQSLRARGQQTPVELVAQEEGRFGLISGWRRMTALARLHEETGEDRFATVLAVIRTPETAADAYVAMVEENEIRVGLSYYERARVVLKTVQAGVYPDETAALRALFASASRAKRSKIGSFVPVVRKLGNVLAFPTALPERLGLQLSKLVEDADRAHALVLRLLDTAPVTAEEERALLAEAVSEKPAATPAPKPARRPADITVTHGAGGLTLTGPGVDAAFEKRLRAWLARQG